MLEAKNNLQINNILLTQNIDRPLLTLRQDDGVAVGIELGVVVGTSVVAATIAVPARRVHCLDLHILVTTGGRPVSITTTMMTVMIT